MRIERREAGLRWFCGGGRGIRTPGTVSRTAVFKTAAIDHSAIPPRADFSDRQEFIPFSLLRRTQ